MKTKPPFVCLLSFVALVAACSLSAAQPSQLLQKQAVQLRKTLERNHYQPRTIDDQFSSQVFYQLLGLLDPNHLYLTADDRKELAVYRYQLDDELKGNGWNFLPRFTTLYRQRLTQADKTISEILQKPLTYIPNETLTLPENDSTGVGADTAYVARWTKWLKYRTLLQLVNAPAQEGRVVSDEPRARQLVGTIAQRNIKRIVEHPDGFENYVGSLYFHAITTCFDPHTDYFSGTDRENFESALSSEGLSFGLDLEENADGSVAIARLVPGGPAWKSNELHKGDVLTTLKWNGKAAVDLAGSDLDEVMELLAASNAGRLDLTVRDASGQQKTVSLVKEKLREDENIVKSFLLKGDKKIGYVSLPGFYTQWGDGSGSGCADDLAKEIVKLKEEGIDGLILDIRDNGGGSLTEGLSLAGIFIDQGPLLVMQGKNRKPYVMKDMNRGTIYDGPLVLMINGQSASASELLASTLQDYHRALLVGSTTFGKATGQVVMPLDSAKRVPGFVKVTLEKLYRITGKSAQLQGVRPDVPLPDVYENLDYREASFPFALRSDSVNKKTVYSPLKALPVNELAGKSAARVSSSASFQLISQFKDYQKSRKQQVRKAIPLNLPYFKDRAAERDRWVQSLEKLGDTEKLPFTVENNRYSQELMRVDTYGKELNDFLIKNMREDVYLAEAYQVIRDLILLTNPN